MTKLTASDRWIIVGAAFAFWIFIPVPFWLLGMGFAGELVLWPSFEPDVALLSTLFVIAFYGPLLLIALVTIDALRSRTHRTEDAGVAE